MNKKERAMQYNKVVLIAAAVILASLNAIADEHAHAPEILASPDGEIAIHPINHATFVMEHAGTTIYVDPVGGADLFAAFDPPDVILITHIHGDHTSAETVAGVSTEQTLILAPSTVADKLGTEISGNLTIIANGESLKRPELEVEAIPAYNLSEDRLGFHPKERGDNAYVVTIGDTRIFISGDTEDTPEMRALEDIDAAFLCMNLPYTMTVERAADATLAFAPKIVYPYHYRGKGGLSDLEAFERIVADNPGIEVRLLDWY
jgi:L-ascorbate metabolism protein UlaG (beta-lactamase superfamily)